MCNCIETVNTALKERNTRIQTFITFKSGTPVYPVVGTEQIEKGRGKQKAIAMFPSFCPFCGERYGEVTA